jgi:hypothetical protein
MQQRRQKQPPYQPVADNPVVARAANRDQGFQTERAACPDVEGEASLDCDGTNDK